MLKISFITPCARCFCCLCVLLDSSAVVYFSWFVRSSDALHPRMSGIIGFIFCIFGVLVFALLVQAQENRGTPGDDYPNYHSIPETSFSCSEQKYIPGFYADLETKCQAFHFCFQDHKESFLCPTGTTFNQAILACDNWFNSNCSLAPLFYNVNVGPIMENAGRKLPMLLKLRSRSPGKASKPESVVPEKDELLSSGIQSQHTESNNNEVTDSQATEESIDTKVVHKPLDSNNQFSDLSDNEQTLNDYSADLPEENESVVEVDEEMDNLVFDPVANDYYTNDSPYEIEWQDSGNDEFNSFYNRGDGYVLQGTSSSSAFNDYVDGDQISEDGIDSLTGNMNNVAGDFDPAAFSKRMQIERSRRVRRKPVYVMVSDDVSEFGFASQHEPVLSDDPQSSESLAGEGSQSHDLASTGEEISTESSVEETTRAEPFPRPTRIPPHLLELNTPTPMSTEQFGAAIFSELVEPYLPDDYGTIIASTYTQPETQNSPVQSEVEPQSMSDDPQGDDQTVYVEVMPGQTGYESYASEYGGQGKVEDLGSTYKLRMYSKSDAQYETDNAEETDSDTFVVIPDEADEVERDLGEDSNANYKDQAVGYQMDAKSQTFADYGVYEDAYDYEPNAYFPESYGQADPISQSQYVRSIPKTWSDQRQTYDTINSELNYVPGYPYVNDGVYTAEGVDFENYSPEMARIMYQRLMNARLRNYHNQFERQQDQANYGDSSYDSESPYSYADFYNPYSENGQMQYEESVYSEPYSDSEDSAWIEKNEVTEIPGVFGVTDNPLPLPVTDADLDLVSERLGENLLSDAVPEEGAEQNEEYYVFDGDEQMSDDEGSMTYEAESNKSILPDPEHPNLQNLYEMEKLNGSSDSFASHDNVSLNAKQSPDVSKASDEFSLNTLLESKEDRTNSDSIPHKAKADFKPFATSAHVADGFTVNSPSGSTLGRLATSHGIGSSKSEGLGLSSDSGYLNNMAFQESMDFGPYGFGGNVGQQYSMLESLQPGKTRTQFSHRTGESDQSRLSKLSAFQEKMRSMKQGKFGAFKKYISSSKD